MRGKNTASAVYIHYQSLGPSFRHRADMAAITAKYQVTINTVVKFPKRGGYVSLLEYESFMESGHPRLLKATIVYDDRSVKVIDYSKRENPPILHRKELVVSSDRPDYKKKFARLTREEEAAGLLTNNKRIGYRKQWEELLAKKGYMVVRHNLVRL